VIRTLAVEKDDPEKAAAVQGWSTATEGKTGCFLSLSLSFFASLQNGKTLTQLVVQFFGTG